MQHLQKQNKEVIVAKIIEQINQKLPLEQSRLVAEFARQYYSNVDYEDLAAFDILDLYGAVLSHWELVYQRKPEECKIRIYNPDYETNGWQSTHTIIEITQDDMPFLVDSLQIELNRLGLNFHLIIHFGGMKLLRDETGKVIEVLPFDTPIGDGVVAEAPIHMEVDRQTDPAILEDLTKNLRKVLNDVRAAVKDWPKMRAKLREALTEIEKGPLPATLSTSEISEAKDFLRWLDNDHFTYLGYRRYELSVQNGERVLKLVPNSSLGILRDISSSHPIRPFSSLTSEAVEQALSDQILVISKTNRMATVHRGNAYPDYVGKKCFNEKGEVIGEHRFIGLYTSTAYTENPKHIPLVRSKVSSIMKQSNLSPTGHAAKALRTILDTLPRDDLFQASSHELAELAMGIFNLQERKRIRFFARMDVFHRFLSCLVFVPRDRFDTDLCYSIQDILKEMFKALEITFTTWFSESTLARIHYVIRIDPHTPLTYDIKAIEAKLIEISRSFKDDLKQCLLDYFGEEKGNSLFCKYHHAFPAGYREAFNAHTAIYDIEHIEFLSEQNPLTMSFFRPLEESINILRFKLFRPDETMPLSDSLPIFENMGLRVIGERPYKITLVNNKQYWINDFSMVYSQEMAFEIETIKSIFQETFLHVWNEDAENDGFNRLVLGAGLSWREITIIRAYTKYLRQIGITYSQAYMEECFVKYPTVALLLVQLFLLRFDPKQKDNAEPITNVEAKIRKEMEAITILDEDRILRYVHEVINATLRTNYFQKNPNQKPKSFLSVKLNPKLISDMPLPLPMYEIFVYSPEFEGVHLRSSKVARGGIRWSDRREDFRTEILGLMKAQNVKNAVIVPSGAKGGFVPKKLPVDGSREEIMAEGIKCYKNFIRGLLDLTDNIVNNEIVAPPDTVCYDDNDEYLVVAADKGTATFSDIANDLAAEYNFWLGDAFASGGSSGYDHKKIAITARGAWISVERHFRTLGMNIHEQDFTVVGIGDMGGDVFGNGMLLSRHIKLIGAFDHRHIFIDPNPDPEISFEERVRLFNLARSSWEDYNRSLISKGGGVYRRDVKAIQLSPQIKKLLKIKKEIVVPSELIRGLLRAQVDLLWNGGIGTFVKSKSEENSNVGDRTNDGIRINGGELQCRVVGEGGNLGFTQLGRVEYDLKGGLIYTDFIDNSAGVDCSDHEVNIKILFNEIITHGDMTHKQRDNLLVEMTNEVAKLVLEDNYHQTQALEVATFRASRKIDLHERYINVLVQKGLIDRELEFLPNHAVLAERKAMGKGLTRPELAILLAYSKILIKSDILESDIPEEAHLSQALELAFPKLVRDNFRKELQTHRLRREIIATVISNALVNETGFTFVYELYDVTGASAAAIIKAYTITRNIFQINKIICGIEQLDYKIPAQIQIEMMNVVFRMMRRVTRWLLRNRQMQLDITSLQDYFSPSLANLRSHLDEVLVGHSKQKYEEVYHKFADAQVPHELAEFIAAEQALISGLDIIAASQVYQLDMLEIATTYFALNDRLNLFWFREQLNDYVAQNQWESMARESCRDDIDTLQCSLAVVILKSSKKNKSVEEKISAWFEAHKVSIDRWQAMWANIKANKIMNLIIFPIVVRELMDLIQHNSKIEITDSIIKSVSKAKIVKNKQKV
jgi:glutamate dehydrogenase